MTASRVGIGFDVHKFDPEAPLMLGCVAIDDHPGLSGHSDADVIAHAICDALLGAAGLGDMGKHFPDTDELWKGVSGLAFLEATKELIGNGGWSVGNVDCTVIAETPKLSPHCAVMETRMTEVIGAPVNVKATRAEGLGALGRAEGIACYAVALLEKP